MIAINFDHSERYQPGDPIRGGIEWSELPNTTTKIEVRLIWYTMGKGTQDDETVARQEILTPGSSGKSNFEFVAPHRPLSFSGTLISLIWAIEVIVFPTKLAEQKTVVIAIGDTDLVLSPIEEPKKAAWLQTNR